MSFSWPDQLFLAYLVQSARGSENYPEISAEQNETMPVGARLIKLAHV